VRRALREQMRPCLLSLADQGAQSFRLADVYAEELELNFRLVPPAEPEGGSDGGPNADRA
jgi:hypothetical protein